MRTFAGWWRRSIQARVVVSTIALSALAIGFTGWALLGAVAEGLTGTRRDAAIAEARSGFDYAQSQLDATADVDSADQAQVLNEMVDSLSSSLGTSRTYELLLEGPIPEGGSEAPVRSSTAIDADSLPADLRSRVLDEPGTFWRYAGLSLIGDDDARPSVVVGQRLRAPRTGDLYAMFYLYSLEDQQGTLDLVRRALLLGGIAMVLFVAGIAHLVSRQVLDPVRLARRVAERYASGNLEQRMHVRGDDDIARLSASFNQMAASLQSQIRRLENLSRLQQRFVSDVSHELRTPLTTVQMASSVVHEARTSLPPHGARAAELLKAELDHFEELLSDLLDLSRFDAGAARLELDAVDLSAVAEVAAAHPMLARHGIDATVVGADRPAIVEADIRRVDRIVRNLVTNAAKYSQGSRVEIEVAAADEVVALIVRDDGVGLGEEETARVFDRFWRADPARSQGGTGLGLAIAREDAGLHGGTLTAGGQPGEGATFVLTLPRQADPSPERISRIRPGETAVRIATGRPATSAGTGPEAGARTGSGARPEPGARPGPVAPVTQTEGAERLTGAEPSTGEERR